MRLKYSLASWLVLNILATFSGLKVDDIALELGKLSSINKIECLKYGISNDREGECCKVAKIIKGSEIKILETEFKCLPSFMIAGTQKSGTTVLSALLSKYSIISFPHSKEAHFFDKDRLFGHGKYRYLQFFKSWNVTNDFHHQNQLPPIYGDATPFYVASRTACGRIAEMIPNVKMIILMREPIARAYSEYHMKRRYTHFDCTN